MIETRWDSRPDDDRRRRVRRVSESWLIPYIKVKPADFAGLAKHEKPRYGEAVRVFRERDLQFFDVSFHRMVEGHPKERSLSRIEDPDVMGLEWGGNYPIMFARLLGMDDPKIEVRFKTNGRFRVKVSVGGQRVTGSSHPEGLDYVVVFGPCVQQLKGSLAGVSGRGGYRFLCNDLSSSRRTPAATSLEIEITPEKQREIRPKNSGSIRIVLLYVGKSGQKKNQRTEIWVEAGHSIWRVKHIAWKFVWTTQPSDLHFFKAMENGLLELEDHLSIGDYELESGSEIKVYTNHNLSRLKTFQAERNPPQIVSPSESSMTGSWPVRWDEAEKFLLTVHLPAYSGYAPSLRTKPPKPLDTVPEEETREDDTKKTDKRQDPNGKETSTSPTKPALVPEQQPQQALIDFDSSDSGVPGPAHTAKIQAQPDEPDLLVFGKGSVVSVMLGPTAEEPLQAPSLRSPTVGVQGQGHGLELLTFEEENRPSSGSDQMSEYFDAPSEVLEKDGGAPGVPTVAEEERGQDHESDLPAFGSQPSLL